MKIKANQIDNILRSMTVSVFASLPSAWPEFLRCCGGQGIFVSRIAQNANHLTNDHDVIVRALVFMPDDEIEESHLRRFTIRHKDLDLDPKYVEGAVSRWRYLDYWERHREPAITRVAQYHACARALLEVPQVDLWQLFR